MPMRTCWGLKNIVSACPSLCTLDISGCVAAGPGGDGDVSALLQLAGSCSKLVVGGPAFDDAAAAVVCQLTQLTGLEWHNAPSLSDAGLDQLTALQGLYKLFLRKCDGVSLTASESGRFEGFGLAGYEEDEPLSGEVPKVGS